MFTIKICGVTTADDASAAAAAGADAIGLNFYPESPRYVTPRAAETIVADLPKEVTKVGLFVNAPVDAMRETFDLVRLDAIQLHGDETPELMAELSDLPVLRAFRVDAQGLAPVSQYLHRCDRLGCRPGAILLDARREGKFGGTGQVIDWAAIDRERAMIEGHTVILAGGLTASNVTEAIAQVRPHGVDVSSGVEAAPGVKDDRLVREFVELARRALDDLRG